MRKFLFYLVLGVLLGGVGLSGAQAQTGSTDELSDSPWQTTLSLSELGHSDGIQLAGLQNETELFVPVARGSQPSEMVLRVTPSPSWPVGTIRVLADEQLVKMARITDTTESIRFPLPSSNPTQSTLPISLETATEGTNACTAHRLHYLQVSPESRVTYSHRQSAAQTINQFFPPYLQTIHFYVPASVSNEAMQAALWLAAFAGQKYQGSPPQLTIHRKPDQIEEISAPGPWERAVVWEKGESARLLHRSSSSPRQAQTTSSLPTRYTVQAGDQGLRAIAQEIYGRASAWRGLWEANRSRLSSPDVIIPGQVLQIPQAAGQASPSPSSWSEGGRVMLLGQLQEAEQLFVSDVGLTSAATDQFATDSLVLQAPEEVGARRSLGQLGFPSRSLEGRGTLSTTYTISLADLGPRHYPTGVRLRAPHTPVSEEGLAHARVMLESNQLASFSLPGTEIDKYVPIPRYLLSREMNLHVRVSYTSPQGNCSVSVAPFQATIDPRSFVAIEEGWAMQPGFGRFPQAFVEQFAVYADSLDHRRAGRAMRLISALQRTTSQSLKPQLTSSLSGGEALLALGTQSLTESLGAPVQGPGFQVTERGGPVLLSFRPDRPQALLQGFQNGDRNVLALTWSSGASTLADSLLTDLLQPEGWFNVRGDLAVRGPGGDATLMEVQRKALQVNPLPAESEGIFARYRIWFYLLGALLILGVFVWLYPRLVRYEFPTE